MFLSAKVYSIIYFCFFNSFIVAYVLMSEYSKHVLSRWTVRRQVKRAVQNHFN